MWVGLFLLSSELHSHHKTERLIRGSDPLSQKEKAEVMVAMMKYCRKVIPAVALPNLGCFIIGIAEPLW
jgi:hypothetical protein